MVAEPMDANACGTALYRGSGSSVLAATRPPEADLQQSHGSFEIAQDAQVRSVIRGMPMTDVYRGDALRHAQGDPPQQSVRRGAEQSAAAGSAIPRLLSRVR